MVIFLTTMLLIGSAASYNVRLENDGIDYRWLTSTSVSNFANTDQCNNSLIVCESCTTLGMCVWENGKWTLNPIGKCPIGETCLKGQCVQTENPGCSPTSGFPFMCTATGMFPDQGDCTAYHICVEDQKYPSTFIAFSDTCADEYTYNAKSTYCDKKLPNGCTSSPVPLCKKIGESDIVKENPTLYYVCMEHPQTPPESKDVLYPLLRACPNGRTFNSTTKVCNPFQILTKH